MNYLDIDYKNIIRRPFYLRFIDWIKTKYWTYKLHSKPIHEQYMSTEDFLNGDN